MKIFTVTNGVVSLGATVGRLILKGAGIEIPAILIGEKGRGREQGVLPVVLSAEDLSDFRNGKIVQVLEGSVGKTKSERPNLESHPASVKPSTAECLCVLRTPMGFRGGNAHTGERTDISCPNRGTTMQYRSRCSENAYSSSGGCGVRLLPEGLSIEDGERMMTSGIVHPDEGMIRTFAPFPGTTLVRGVIAEGAAGRMGSGDQFIAIIPSNTTFRTAYSGRLYGKPGSHYYVFNGERVLSATWDERCAADLW
jgi:hypothetical protein